MSLKEKDSLSEAEKSQSVKGVKESFSEKDVEDVNTTLTTLPLVANLTERQSEDDGVETVTLCRDLDEFQRAFEEDCVDIEAELGGSGLVYRDVLLEKLVERAWISVQVLLLLLLPLCPIAVSSLSPRTSRVMAWHRSRGWTPWT